MTSITSDTNVVLKLDLGDQGGMRRISIRKLWDESTQSVSFNKLSEIAIGLYMSSKKSSTRTQDTSVTVTYRDEDGDVITISTDDELAEAFEQFCDSRPPVLRASASITRKKEKTKKSDIPASIVADSMSKKIAKKVPVPAETKQKKILSANKPATTPTDDIQDVLENFVGVLTVAVNTLTKNVPEDLSKADEAIEKALDVPVREDVDIAQSQSKEDESVVAAKTESEKPKEGEGKDEATSNNIPHVPECFDREFIHGRHTCDSCLTTPIIGIRYNATNLPDYDLCQKCIPNYKGSHITFAPSQLERDAQLQPRWKRRHARFLRQAELEKRTNRRTMPTSRSGNGPCSLNIAADSDLKEAIRRSLLDANQKRVAPVVTPKEEVKQEVQKTTQDDEVKRKEEETETKEEEPEIPVSGEDVPVETTVSVPKVEEEVEEQVEPTVSNKEVKSEEKEAIPEDARTQESDIVESTEKLTEDVDNEASASSYKTSAEEMVVDDDISLVKNEEVEETKQNTSTFSIDAEGNGDVAAAIGHALDNCAEAIDAMVEEANKLPSSQSKSSVGPSEAGQTIIEGCPDDMEKEEDDKTEASEDSEWQVLGSVSSQEMIAQAAQMLGSALFQSDMVDSSNNDKVAPSEQSVSNVSAITIPTVVPSIASKTEIASVVLSRWDEELKQLHELGFLDDHRSVEALEHLEAANMGCESDDPVTVEDAINYMLKQGYN